MYLTKLTDNNIKVHKLTDANLKVSGVAIDSRKIKKDMIFAVIKGNKKDGSLYIKEAYKSGASAILCQKIHLKNITQEIKNVLICDNVRLSVAIIAKKFFPKQPINISIFLKESLGIVSSNNEPRIVI